MPLWSLGGTLIIASGCLQGQTLQEAVSTLGVLGAWNPSVPSPLDRDSCPSCVLRGCPSWRLGVNSSSSWRCLDQAVSILLQMTAVSTLHCKIRDESVSAARDPVHGDRLPLMASMALTPQRTTISCNNSCLNIPRGNQHRLKCNTIPK